MSALLASGSFFPVLISVIFQGVAHAVHKRTGPWAGPLSVATRRAFGAEPAANVAKAAAPRLIFWSAR